MARREFQMPGVLKSEGARPYWYIRYRRKVLVGKNQIDRKEVWHTLGDCDKITKRQAQRLREEIMQEVNREVYTVQSQILFRDFVALFMKNDKSIVRKINNRGTATHSGQRHNLRISTRMVPGKVV